MKIVLKEGKNLGFWNWTIEKKVFIKERIEMCYMYVRN